MADPVCVRCDGPLVPLNGTGRWTCARDGEVEPLHLAVPAEPQHVADTAASAGVPLWVPWPMPRGWVASGLRRTATRGLARGVVLALTGPGVTVHQAELLLVAEEPGVGLGAAYAGLDTGDPGPELASLPADTKVTADGHSIPLWSLPVLGADRGVYVGEAAGCWLWVVVWPVSEWMVVHDDLRLVDLRSPENHLAAASLTVGHVSPRLTR